MRFIDIIVNLMMNGSRLDDLVVNDAATRDKLLMCALLRLRHALNQASRRASYGRNSKLIIAMLTPVDFNQRLKVSESSGICLSSVNQVLRVKG
jgi:hypothetical protein